MRRSSRRRRRAGGAARLLDADRGARREADLAIRHHALAGLHAVAQVGGLADDALDRDRARRDLVVGADDPGDHALLRRQNRRRRHRQHARFSSTVSATSTDSPGHSTSSAFSAITLAVIVPVVLSTWLSTKPIVPCTTVGLRAAGHADVGQRLGGKRAPQGAELALRHGERHPDRLGLVDGHQRRRRIDAAHHGADLGAEAAGAAGDRRADGEIVELGLLRLEQRLRRQRCWPSGPPRRSAPDPARPR